jgi:two-component system CheB/CheR fusion protein
MSKTPTPPKAGEIRRLAERRMKDKTTAPIIDDDPVRLIHELRVHQFELEIQNEALAQARQDAEENFARYAALFDHAPVGFITVDQVGVINRANHAATALLGLEPILIGKQRLGAFVHEDSLPSLAQFLKRIGRSPLTETLEISLKPIGKRPSTTLILEGRADIDGTSSNLALIDITARQKDQETLRAAKIDAERANTAKSSFLAATSHDLRQPLQTLTLICGILSRMHADTRTRDLIFGMEQALDVLANMLNILLDLHQIDSGLVKPNLVDVDISPLFERMRREYAYYGGSGGNAWRVVPCTQIVRTDPKLLEQILRNLLSNAFKYTQHGTVLLGCRQCKDRLRIEIWDTGIGIAPEQIEVIFDEYHQIDNPARQRSHGLGLGLAIVRRQSALLGSPVRVRSWPGRGSVFSIEVPLGSAASQGLVPDQPAPRSVETIHRKSILVIEDDRSVRAMLSQLLTAEGGVVVEAGDAASALARITQPPDLVIADHALPNGMTGLGVVTALRKRFSVRLPAIILTGDVSAQTLRAIASLPDCQSLTKPVTADTLFQAAGALLPSPGEFPRPRPPAPAIAASRPSGVPDVFVVDDDTQLREAITLLIEGEGHVVEAFPDAESFLDHYRPGGKGCLLVDAVMPGLGGIDLLRDLRRRGDPLPTIVMTGHGDMSIAVAAMKAGAQDFIAKPIETPEILAAIDRALAPHDIDPDERQRNQATSMIAGLTTRERQVLDQLLAGQPNKLIAHTLCISQRTVENHRASIMRKTESKTLLDLYRTMLDAGI